MSTTLIITVGSVVLIVVVLKKLLFRKPRMHAYLFAHGVLPNLALSNPDEVLSALLSPTGQSKEGEAFLIQLWMSASEQLPASEHLPAAGLSYAMEVLHSPRSAVYWIQLPEPLRPPEAYFAAIVFDSVAFAAGQPAGVRYFTLERSFGDLKMIGESRFDENGELQRIDHDECPGKDKESFLAALRKVVSEPTG